MGTNLDQISIPYVEYNKWWNKKVNISSINFCVMCTTDIMRQINTRSEIAYI